MLWHAAEKLANLQQRERSLRVEQFTVDALFVLHRLAVLGLQLYNVHLTALERANLPFLVLAVALLCRGPLGSYVLSRRRAKASASRLDFLLRPGLGCLVTLNVGYCAGLLFQRHELHYSLLLLLPLLARQLLFGGAAGSAFGGWYRDVMPHGMSAAARVEAHARRIIVDAAETALVAGFLPLLLLLDADDVYYDSYFCALWTVYALVASFFLLLLRFLQSDLIELYVPLSCVLSNKTACLPTQGAPQPSSLPACSTPGSIECATNWAAGLILRWPALLHKGLVAWELGMVGMWSSAIFAAAERSEVGIVVLPMHCISLLLALHIERVNSAVYNVRSGALL